MRKIPYHKCAACNSYSPWNESRCSCGTQLAPMFGVLRVVEETAADLPVNEKLYVQKCSNCGALNITRSKEHPVQRCMECNKIRIQKVAPVEYIDTEEEQKTAIPDPDEDVTDWDDILSDITDTMKEVKLDPVSVRIRLVACNGYTCTIHKEETPFMIGRAAGMREFLAGNLEVGNEHCMILMRDDKWYVQDNHSGNGTFVNGRDLGEGGNRPVQDSDVVKLGHRPDSITFKVVMEYENS